MTQLPIEQMNKTQLLVEVTAHSRSEGSEVLHSLVVIDDPENFYWFLELFEIVQFARSRAQVHETKASLLTVADIVHIRKDGAGWSARLGTEGLWHYFSYFQQLADYFLSK